MGRDSPSPPAGIRAGRFYHAAVTPDPPPPPTRPCPVGTASWAVRGAAVAALAAGGVAVAILARHHPSGLTFLPPCPSAMLGFACAGCGSTRAVHFLLQGDVASAWRHNPMLVLVGVPCAAIGGFAAIRAAWTGRWPRSRLSPTAAARLGMALAIVLIGWTVARNLPGESFSALRPPPRASAR